MDAFSIAGANSSVSNISKSSRSVGPVAKKAKASRGVRVSEDVILHSGPRGRQNASEIRQKLLDKFGRPNQQGELAKTVESAAKPGDAMARQGLQEALKQGHVNFSEQERKVLEQLINS